MQALKILAVEHDPPLLELYEKLLSKRGHRVVATRSGGEAVTHLSDDIDVVVVDLRSHRSMGHKVLEAIHSDPYRAEVPVLIVDGSKDAGELVRGPHSLTLHKPFRFDRFVEAVEALATTRSPRRPN
jgi:DNA-binding response OmpR family regulator